MDNPRPRSSDEPPHPQQKLSQRELAIEKIRRLATTTQQKPNKCHSKSSIRGKLQCQMGRDEKKTRKITQEDRRNSFPQGSTSTGQGSERSSMPTNFNSASAKLPVPARRFSSGDAPRLRVAAGLSSSTSSSAQCQVQRKVKFLDTPQLQSGKRGPNPRKSSFPLRKRQDNKLAYRGRDRHHRHEWQAEREQEFKNYRDGAQSDDFEQ